MAEKEFITRIKNKIDTHQNWSTNNPILLAGEVVIVTEVDGNQEDVRIKVGNGVNNFNSLPWASSKFDIPIATEAGVGGIKSGGDISIDTSGNVSIVDNSHNHIVSNITDLTENVVMQSQLVQESGESQSNIMSQKAVTDAINLVKQNTPYIKEFSESSWVANTSSDSNAAYMMSIPETEHNRGEHCIVTAIFETLGNGNLVELLSENMKNSSGDITIFSNSAFSGVVYIDRVYPQEILSNQNNVPVSVLTEQSYNSLTNKDNSTLYLIRVE